MRRTVFCLFPRTGQAMRKLGSAFKSEEATSLASKCGYAAAAIMAALSVERDLLGKNTFTPIGADLDWNVSRMRNWRLRRLTLESYALPFRLRLRAFASRGRERRLAGNWKSERGSAGCTKATNRRLSGGLPGARRGGHRFPH